MSEIVIYSTQWCPYCVRAKALLEQKGAAYVELDVSSQPQLRLEMMEKSGRRTVPQIWIGDTHVGGCDELYALERQRKLDALLSAEICA